MRHVPPVPFVEGSFTRDLVKSFLDNHKLQLVFVFHRSLMFATHLPGLSWKPAAIDPYRLQTEEHPLPVHLCLLISELTLARPPSAGPRRAKLQCQ